MASNNSNVPDPDVYFALYRYTPSMEAAIVAAAAFAVLTALHAWRMMQARAFYFVPFVIGGIFEVIGYCGRIWSHYELNSVPAYSIQQLFILLAPALLAASVYMILGRIISALGAQHFSIIPLRFLTKIFVIGDVISFLVQGGGGGIQAAGTLELFELGEKMIVVGLFIQLAFFGFFMVTTVVFNVRINAHPTKKTLDGTVPWKRYLIQLYLASIIIMIRSVFRVVEYVQGNNGYIIRREYLLYIFDAVLMGLVMITFLVKYIGGLDAGYTSTRLDDESMDLVGMEPSTEYSHGRENSTRRQH